MANNEDAMIIVPAMKRAIVLALRGAGKVRTNPLVGAVILKDAQIISEGWHHEFGQKHAEIEAIDKLKESETEGATLVINLEPCAHYGKTPPCVPVIIEKKFAKVIVGMQDPNPLVARQGISKLKEAGIEVITGVLEKECRWLNRTFTKHITTGMPYVILKAAQSLDGCISTSKGESKWLSCEESRKRVHELRAFCDSVIIGKGTANADDPHLTVRDAEGVNPKKIVIDTNLTLPLSLNIFKDSINNKTYVCCSDEQFHSDKAYELKAAGVNIVPCEINSENKIILRAMLKKLYDEHNISSVLVEGGGGIYSSFAREDLIDELHLFIAPKIIGNGKKIFGELTTDNLTEALQLNLISANLSGEDLHVIYCKNSLI
jgi:diaminohydroxyphosphoribosylaminopyrimidine deaminase/5-amino-6-(5-phosphoribosylamino)uracil reductase